jgi:hypothetical protein
MQTFMRLNSRLNLFESTAVTIAVKTINKTFLKICKHSVTDINVEPPSRLELETPSLP